jgi:Domain of unknown function (DUF5753)
MGAYNNSVIHGLLQTEDYARAAFTTQRPPLPEEKLELLTAARMARQSVLEPVGTAPVCSFVQDEVTLRRLLGGVMVMRKQLEHLLEVAQRRNVDIQVLPDRT